MCWSSEVTPQCRMRDSFTLEIKKVSLCFPYAFKTVPHFILFC